MRRILDEVRYPFGAWLPWAWYRLRYPRFCFPCDQPTFRRHDHRLPRETIDALTEAVAARERARGAGQEPAS